jgi:hypothetical protein
MNMEHCQIFPVIRQITFQTGHLIDVHKIEDGTVWYQVWPPGVQNQSVFANLTRMPLADFDRQVAERGGVDVPRPETVQ